MSSPVSPQQRAARRMQRELELFEAERRRLLPETFRGVGKYNPLYENTIERRVARQRSTPSPWAIDRTVQHIINDNHGRQVDFTRKTQVGDPGYYVSHSHEMGSLVERRGNAAMTFYSAIPQRPVSKLLSQVG